MKYQQPYGIADPNAPYINGDPSIARQGSIPPAAAFEFPMRELVNVITKSKIAPSDDDLMQLTQGIRSQALNYVEDTGSVNTLSVALDPPLTAYTLGLPIHVRIRTTNTGGATIDAGAGRVPIKLMNGGGTSAGDLPAGGICELVYDGSAFQLTNFFGLGGAGGTGTQFLIKIPYTVDTSATPNIVIAPFAPAITTLSAGDPLLVKINNTCSGSSVIRVNALADKTIKANGGDILLQGDIQKNDVVLFLYDGTQFWIAPNPLISADTTINVPSQYSTVENALLAIRRKTIAQNATVTVKIAQSNNVAPFTINHANADRLVIAGTMKIAGNLTNNMFWQSGNSSAQQASDSANNIAMLRTRYGTEVKVPGTGGANSFHAGVQNVGPGNPTVKDILITGPNVWSGNGIGAWVGVNVDSGRTISLNNVAAWGLDIGFYGGGILLGNYCWSSGCFNNGTHATGLAQFGYGYSGFYGCQGGGMICNQNAFMTAYSSFANVNAQGGVVAADNSEFTFHTSTATGNGVDATASLLSLMMLLSCSVGTTSPAPGVMDAYGAIVVQQ